MQAATCSPVLHAFIARVMPSARSCLVLSCRDNARAEFVTSLGLGGTVLYNPGAQRATLEVDDWGPAAALNSVLWRIYPEANLLEGENIAGALDCGPSSLSIASAVKGFNAAAAAAAAVMLATGRLVRTAYVRSADALWQRDPCPSAVTARQCVIPALSCSHLPFAGTELVAVLRADQALAPDFFLRTLPALEVQDVRLAQGRPVYSDLPAAADVFDMVRPESPT